ncbi:MAG: hypothetical protein IMZ71_01865 [Chloroflexi bacterium]|nr:hypothetical protein [Chloroflexota bacterium]
MQRPSPSMKDPPGVVVWDGTKRDSTGTKGGLTPERAQHEAMLTGALKWGELSTVDAGRRDRCKVRCPIATKARRVRGYKREKRIRAAQPPRLCRVCNWPLPKRAKLGVLHSVCRRKEDRARRAALRATAHVKEVSDGARNIGVRKRGHGNTPCGPSRNGHSKLAGPEGPQPPVPGGRQVRRGDTGS